MGKIEIKSIGIMITIMILLNFAQPVLSHGVFCDIKCKLQCVALKIVQHIFDKCMNDCRSHCSQLSNHPFNNCISDCHIMKSNAINDGTPDMVNNEMNTCIQKCKRIL
ncbi:uncharacterized protein HKW66_Vig0221440 [Vigna angularis]|uniref:Plant thionin family protein n=2 Tax=Phaseolus angularis TaxID=3914 RepID=A0A8T0K028_PHAAN|nr:uncharacterized protein HKW66_Vig0221440 [Vigna angularis]BAT82747.1 hypothetical protein VIGAN_03280600 [Vigna angularis var. angularis]